MTAVVIPALVAPANGSDDPFNVVMPSVTRPLSHVPRECDGRVVLRALSKPTELRETDIERDIY